MHLRTKRLWLRSMQVEDVPLLVDMWTDPDVTQFLGGPREIESLRAILAEDAADSGRAQYDLWPVEELATKRVVGHCGLLDKEIDGTTEIELVYVLATSAWGKGYATEIGCALKTYAFEQMRLRRLVSLIDPANVASERVAEKLGMRFEREIVRPGGALKRLYAAGA